jgi:hypothetical protein
MASRHSSRRSGRKTARERAACVLDTNRVGDRRTDVPDAVVEK